MPGKHIAQAWAWLDHELERWSDLGIEARFWWRDDDASETSAALEQLLALADLRRAPLALAVIPQRLKPGLADCLGEHGGVCVLQHGFAHDNHARAGQRKIEIGGSRPLGEMARDLAAGRRVLERYFRENFVPVLVPPWNRIEPSVVQALPGLGFRGISTLKARPAANPVSGLLQVNAHLDPIDWRQRNGFVGVYPAIAVLLQHLVARRSGYRDPAEPTGILSHHLVQNDATWRFLDDLLRFIGEHPAATLVDARDIWRQVST